MEEYVVGTPIDILLVEDNPGDVRLTEEVLKEQKIRNNLYTVGDGEEAMKFMRREGRYANAPRPGLVLLDLNLPKKDGRDVLAEVKRDSDLRGIPVAILTTSQSEEDILRSYGLHANSYITKPVDLEQLMTVVRSVKNLWLTVVTAPDSGNKRSAGVLEQSGSDNGHLT